MRKLGEQFGGGPALGAGELTLLDYFAIRIFVEKFPGRNAQEASAEAYRQAEAMVEEHLARKKSFETEVEAAEAMDGE